MFLQTITPWKFIRNTLTSANHLGFPAIPENSVIFLRQVIDVHQISTIFAILSNNIFEHEQINKQDVLKVETSDSQMSVCEQRRDSGKLCSKSCDMMRTTANSEFGTVQKRVNLIDLEKYCTMSLGLQRSALIKPRTDLQMFR